MVGGATVAAVLVDHDLPIRQRDGINSQISSVRTGTGARGVAIIRDRNGYVNRDEREVSCLQYNPQLS